DADDDQLFVEGLCKKLAVDFVAEKVNVTSYAKENKKSIETAARNLRKDALIRIARENQSDVIVTAHHKNDNAETLIHRILRGTAFRGLIGINPKITFDGILFIRPLLCVGRNEILGYLKKNKLSYRDDHTNLDTRFKRNFVRHRLLPFMQQNSESDLIETLDTLSRSSHKLAAKIDEKLQDLLPTDKSNSGKASISLSLFDQQHPLIKVELIRAALGKINCGEQGFTQAHYKKIMTLSNSPTHRRLELPSGCCVRLDYDSLVFYRGNIEPKPSVADFPAELKVPGITAHGNIQIEASVLDAAGCDIVAFRKNKDVNTEWFDYDKLDSPIIIRPRREGDKFSPLGLRGVRKVGKVLTDAKISPSQRAAVRVIEDCRNIIWLWPLRCSDLSKVNASTRKILQIKIKPV
ncbi:MAG: tRNA lysidine(34) synthetase TilS, partial [Phycisphaerae bacterium]|nr:tRNA lysidine(34) synthetase TilS [Phycisphaerae bacterium]